MMVVIELKMGFLKLKPRIWLTVIINTLIMKSFDQTFKIVPQKKNLKCFKETVFAFLTNILLLKESMSVLMRLPL